MIDALWKDRSGLNVEGQGWVPGYDELIRLAREADDLAEAVRDVLKPVHSTIGRMRWNGPHRDKVQTELVTMTQAVGRVAARLHEEAETLRRMADERRGLGHLQDQLVGSLENDLLGPAKKWLPDPFTY